MPLLLMPMDVRKCLRRLHLSHHHLILTALLRLRLRVS
jgi:hypothetical protein